MTPHTVKSGAPRIPITTHKNGQYRIHCQYSTSGDVSGDFCKFCRNQCVFAGKTIDEIISIIAT